MMQPIHEGQGKQGLPQVEAKETVLSGEEAKRVILALGHCSPETKMSDISITDIEQTLLIAQAEATWPVAFKAGQECERAKIRDIYENAYNWENLQDLLEEYVKKGDEKDE